ncbi:MAG: hypothetical protein HOC74_24030 [Gemmatimonadetes bacterium]|jgi:3',5'-nucleoside bisphosphate phosphatase|nr:hypothetical protein [Gemmatimonadota bacterium]
MTRSSDPAPYDLHLHTCWSYDATAQAERYFERARQLAMRCITITDHHILDSWDEVQQIASNYPEIRTFPSAELTVTTSIGAVDLLCYGFPQPFPESLSRVLENYHDWQREAGAAWSRGMQALGHDFTDAHRLELLESYRPPRAIAVQGNTHVKNQFLKDYFVDRGFISDAEEYPELTRQVRAKTASPPYPHVSDVVPVVKQLDVPIAIAHPHGYFKGCDQTRMDSLRDECALDGIECAHQSVPAEITPLYREYCERHDLFSTGGSDCHADENIEGTFALHGGAAEWLDELLDRLDARQSP